MRIKAAASHAGGLEFSSMQSVESGKSSRWPKRYRSALHQTVPGKSA